MSWPVDPTAFVLGELGPPDAERAEALERDDPEFAAATAAARRVAGILGVTGPPAEAEPQVVVPTIAAARARSLRRLRRRAAVGAAALVLAAGGAAIGWAVADEDPSSDAAPVRAGVPLDAPGTALVAGPVAPASARGALRMVTGRDGRVALDARGLPPTRGSSFYTLWMGSDAGRRVAVGTFRTDAAGRVSTSFPLVLDPRRYPDAEVTREDASAPADLPHDRSVVLVAGNG